MSETEAERERRSFAARVSLLFAALSVIIGTNLPYLPVAGLGLCGWTGRVSAPAKLPASWRRHSSCAWE